MNRRNKVTSQTISMSSNGIIKHQASSIKHHSSFCIRTCNFKSFIAHLFRSSATVS